jgi:HEAT repeat protein
VRVDAVTALAEVKDPGARNALIAATRDADARVRARAVTSLAASRDPSLANLYEKLLNDQSYAVIKAAALALGETRSASAYETLAKLLNVHSWRDNIKASALLGLAELQDKRALDIAFRYAEPGNTPEVRAAALRLLGRIGSDNPKAFAVIADTAGKAFVSGNATLAIAAADALVSLGDARGLEVLEQIGKNASLEQRWKDQLHEYQDRLRKAVAGTAGHGAKHP